MYEAIDCLSFAGGFTMGVVQAGFKLVGKRELPGGFGMDNCEANRHLLGDSWVGEVGPPDAWSAREVPFVFGNPPCSGFSLMTVAAARGIDAAVNECMWQFTGFAARCSPQIIVFESVQQAFVTGRPLMQALRARLEEQTGWRYNLYHTMHNGYELGGPAVRRRYFFVAVRDDVRWGVEWPTVRKPLLRDAWDDLAGLSMTWESQPYRRPPTWWSATHVRDADQLGVDGHMNLTSLAANRVHDVLDMARELNGGWPVNVSIATMLKTLYDDHGRIPKSWDYRVDRLIAKNFDMGFTIPYRWNGNRPGRVIVGGALNLAIHPTEDRLITHREAARVMGFPDNWRISTIPRTSAFPMTWGKGITTMCGKWIATNVKNALDGNPGRDGGTLIGDREWIIESTPKHGKVLGIEEKDVVEEGLTNV